MRKFFVLILFLVSGIAHAKISDVLAGFKAPAAALGLSEQAYFLYAIDTGDTTTLTAMRDAAVEAGDIAFFQTAIDAVNNGGTMQEVLDDLTPQLGGDLDLNSFKVVDGANRFLHKTGTNNVFLGEIAGNLSVTGSANTVAGRRSGLSLSSGSSNTLLGHNVAPAMTTQTNNTLVGDQAGINVIANDNTIVGSAAGGAVTSGSQNAILGKSGGATLSTGIRNTILGTSANVTTGNIFDSIAIGYQANVDASNKARFGNDNMTAAEFTGKNAGDLFTLQLSNDDVADADPAGSFTIKASNKTAGTGAGGNVTLKAGDGFGGGANGTATVEGETVFLNSTDIKLPFIGVIKGEDDNNNDANPAPYNGLSASDKKAGTGRGGNLYLKGGEGFGGGIIGDVIIQGERAFMPSGTGLTKPGITYEGDGDTGFYRSAADTVSHVVGGLERLKLRTCCFNSYAELNLFGTTGGTEGAPIITFNADPDTGLYNTTNVLYVTAGGLTVSSWSGGLTQNFFQVRNSDRPTLLLDSNSSTGKSEIWFGDDVSNNNGTIIYDHSASPPQLNFTANTINTFSVTSSGTVANGVSYTILSKHTANGCSAAREGAIFYNDTANYMCYCDGTATAKQVHDPATSCF